MTGMLALTRFDFSCEGWVTIFLSLTINLSINELKNLTGNVIIFTRVPEETSLLVWEIMILL